MNEIVKRSISGIIFCAVLLAAVLASFWSYLAVFACCMVLVLIEYLNLTMGKGKRGVKSLVVLAALCLYLGAGVWASPSQCSSAMTALNAISSGLLGGGLLLLCSIPVANLFSGSYKGLSHAYTGLMYIALPFTLLHVLYVFCPADAHWLVASILIIMWAGDVGAYCIGTAFGQGARGHKLMPSVSPKKSWEGVAGGVMFGVIAAVILYYCGVWEWAELWRPIVLSVAIVATSILGDLVESQLKRHLGVKDSGSIIPGHGGFLDRFDSALLVFPVATLLYCFILAVNI